MWKRIGLLALLLSSLGSVVLPTAAFAQNGYYGRYDNGNNRYWDRDDRYDRRDRWERQREHEWRERQWREQRWREREWRRQQFRQGQWDRRYYSDPYFYFGYR